MPPGGSGAVGLEDYMLVTADDEAIGNVAVVLDHHGSRYVVGELGTPPFVTDRLALGVATLLGVLLAITVVSVTDGAAPGDSRCLPRP